MPLMFTVVAERDTEVMRRDTPIFPAAVLHESKNCTSKYIIPFFPEKMGHVGMNTSPVPLTQ